MSKKEPFYKDKRWWWGLFWGVTVGRGIIIFLTVLGIFVYASWIHQ